MKSKRTLLLGLFFSIICVCLVVTTIVVARPEYYHALFGLKLRYAPPKTPTLFAIQLAVAEGKSVQGADTPTVDVELNDTSSFSAGLEEVCTSNEKSGTLELEYKLKQVRSEQMAYNQPGDKSFKGFGWAASLTPFGHMTSVKVLTRSKALWARDSVNWIWLSSLWSELPHHNVRVGDEWTSEVQAFCTLAEKPDGFPISIRLKQKLIRMQQVQGLDLAEIEYSGPISSSAAEIKGNLEGKSMFSMGDGRCLAASFISEFGGVVPLKLGDSSLKLVYKQKLQGNLARGVQQQ
jgi:hypothetical protein